MNKLTLLFGVLLCLVLVNARHYGDRNDGEILENEEETLKRHNSEGRHRRKRWQMNYGYDYPSPAYHYPERREYDRNDYQLLQQISKTLEDILAYIRRPPPPPPPPQPIYIPYPVPYYPQIQQAPCNPPKTNENVSNVDVTKRISEKDMDPNRIWGVVVSKDSDYEDGSDGSRPISFDPIVPKQLMKRPAPSVEHGSVQASITTLAPKFLEEAPVSAARVPAPSMCSAAILSCCGMSENKAQQKQCFGNIGCSETYADGNACNPKSIQNALDSIKAAYSPVN